MKTNLTRIVLLSALLTTASGAFAHEDYSERGATHWLEHLQASPSQPSERQLAQYGYAVPGTPSRVITIDKDTRYLNVVRLETVAIRKGDKNATWMFDAPAGRSFPLSKIVPGTDGVTVYVAEDPLYQGGN